MEEMFELKPCPFCGGKAIFATLGTLNNDETVGYEYCIECSVCRATRRDAKGIANLKLQYNGSVTIINEKGVKSSVNAWNRRAEDARHNADE